MDVEKWHQFQQGFIGNDFADFQVVLFSLGFLFGLFLLGIAYKFATTTTGLRRQDWVEITSGFYQGYAGRVLDRRRFVTYSLIVGGEKRYIARWHLTKRPRTRLSEQLRTRLIEKDRG